ncbi:MAG: HsdR family type I site-specific deoxyribonuclease [Eubacteriales bacterium]|nr:HsdR family type I site-specific deoxyribonuclease [Eubacteriales bacterium]MDD4476340.1 HsdR family type I site-specific deoxyribonuclease [Eubacteriales bacterium]
MNNISFKEDHISQIPALQLLQKLGYTYLSPEEALELRGGKTSNVLLEPILRKQLEAINSIQVSSVKTAYFSAQNIENGIEAMRNVHSESGFMASNEAVYNLLTLGKALEQSIDGDKKSFTLNYIDWKNLKNNVFHVTEEFAVTRSGMSDTYRPDIVLFVNGIPMCVIECKRPDIKDSLEQSISQHLRNQQEDGIRPLYVYSALLLGVATLSASYATTATPAKFWSKWREQFLDKNEENNYTTTLHQLVNTPLTDRQKDILFSSRYRYVRKYFDDMETQAVEPTEQDRYLYSLCRPERLLDLIYNFTAYDDGIKKVARYQQYFAIKQVMERIRPLDGGKRKGGVIWHTQGSGKSLTMVMLAQAIVLEKAIRNPKIILVTDRTDLDRQITGTFKKCGIYVENATTGAKLIELLESKSDAVITTVINKFETAVKGLKKPLEDPNIFVLIDEGHRSQYGDMSIQMQKSLPNACFIAMTGTPLMKKEKSTAAKFGGIILPVYTVDQAVKDKAVVPLLYEGRIVPQFVHENALDNFFDMVSEPFNDYQKADMKRKFSRSDQVNQADQRIHTIAWDISKHYRDNWQETGFKAQLVCPKKRIAIKYKAYLDQIGIVSSEVLITSPDSREGEETAYGETPNEEKAFWKRMMDEHGTAKKYETNLINRFKNSDEPEIIIVVDKLLTGFDEPRNTVMYIDRSLREHTLLQAVARVNRVCEGKEFGYIIDYYGVLQPLNDALTIYADYDPEDLNNMFTDVSDEVAKLPQKHSELWDIFKSISNKRDLEAYSQHLRQEDIRQQFYEKLTAYASCLKIALSSIVFHKETDESQVNRYKEDLAMFLRLRSAVKERYSDQIDYEKYENQIQKLIDTHIESSEVRILTELVDIFDKEKFAEEVEKITGKAAKADTIASRTAKYITENMDTDPAFYKKFSQLLKETISAYEQGRIDEVEYLKQVTQHMESVLSHTDSSVPSEIANNNPARAYYGLSLETFKSMTVPETFPIEKIALDSALAIDSIIREYILDNDKPIIDWTSKTNLIGQMKIDMEDYLIDEVKRKYDIPMSFDDMDTIIDRSVEVAKLWFK